MNLLFNRLASKIIIIWKLIVTAKQKAGVNIHPPAQKLETFRPPQVDLMPAR